MNGRRLINAGNAPGWLVAATAATAIGLVGNVIGGRLPGSEPLSVEDVVDALGALALGALGVVLLRRHRAVGLGRILLVVATLAGSVWLAGGLADLLAAGGTPSTAARLLNLTSGMLFVPLFVTMWLGPLLLFPTGTLPSPRWRALVWLAAAATVGSMLSILIKPGAIDEDVPGWGTNPIGITALSGTVEVVMAVALVVLLVSALGGVTAVVVRLARCRGPRRRQILWFLAGIAPMIIGLLADPGSSTLAQTVSAVVIFGAMVGAMSWALLGGPASALERTPGVAIFNAPATDGWPSQPRA